MKWKSLSLPSVSALLVQLSIANAYSLDDAKNASPVSIDSNVIPGRYIVELSSSSSSRKKRADTPGELVSLLNDLGYESEANFEISSSVFNGVSVQISNENDTTLTDIDALDEVANVWPVEVVLLDEQFDVATERPWNPHTATGVDDLHKRGISGEGVVIGIIDTGVDYTHPALGGGIGEGYTIQGGYDFVGDDWVYTDASAVPDDDPKDCLGHGTHVAGIIAGNNKDFQGVAPGATLRSYKIFGCSDGTTTDMILLAMQKAYEDGVDIITASLGSNTGFKTHPWAIVASRMVEQGVFVSVAAGNAGSTGPYYGSNGASGDLVTAVASVMSKQTMAYPATLVSSSGNELTTYYINSFGTQIEATLEVPVQYVSDSACIWGGANSGDEDTALFIRRGTCIGQSEINGLASAGYKHVFRFNAYGMDMTYEADLYVSSDATLESWNLVEQSVGAWLKSEIDGGNTVTLKIDTSDQATPIERNLAGSGLMNTFSSWGPTYENDFYPTIAAPGGEIFSTWVGGGYAIASGTSMATPYVSLIFLLFSF